MSSSTSFPSTFYTRKLLLHTIPHLAASSPTSPHSLSGKEQSGTTTPGSDFDANVLMVLSVLICGLISALGLNSIIRFAILSCSNRVVHDLGDSTPKLAHTGIKKKALKTFPTVTYSTGLKLPSLGTECVICISEFSPGIV
ncbi:RING-H2 finger protein ATL78-like isoform X2 [Papaver somniferum]|uniref:RING-H2 finger protein ATL78-like isoform X2 n=1 Tax=Papaver somniferum TaxID=3469 RepID=UPI000E6F730D|nr:RING-H2 finger protein ATL78-like isoform X2 [Papaver somniferum]